LSISDPAGWWRPLVVRGNDTYFAFNAPHAVANKHYVNTSSWIPQALDSTKSVRRLSAVAQLDDGYRLRFSAHRDRCEYGTAVSVRGAVKHPQIYADSE
jgi:hypothetical protein